MFSACRLRIVIVSSGCRLRRVCLRIDFGTSACLLRTGRLRNVCDLSQKRLRGCVWLRIGGVSYECRQHIVCVTTYRLRVAAYRLRVACVSLSYRQGVACVSLSYRQAVVCVECACVSTLVRLRVFCARVG